VGLSRDAEAVSSVLTTPTTSRQCRDLRENPEWDRHGGKSFGEEHGGCCLHSATLGMSRPSTPRALMLANVREQRVPRNILYVTEASVSRSEELHGVWDHGSAI